MHYNMGQGKNQSIHSPIFQKILHDIVYVDFAAVRVQQ